MALGADRALVRRVLAWYAAHRRELPWRRTRDPYAIWVSEVMLQQTRVEAVLPFYDRFLARFPNVGALAAAPEEDVLALWSGLGYYGRARMLRRGAVAVMERYGGRIPPDPKALRELPGIGRYTAGAIASIAFGLPEPVVDGNVERVLGRWYALESPAGTARTAEVWRLATPLVPPRTPGDWNQALMELGATVCTPRAPRCAACPARRGCAAFATGRPETIPPARPRPRAETIRVAVALCVVDGRLLLERRSEATPFRGEWDLPARTVGAREDAAAALTRALRSDHALRARRPLPVGAATHSILNRRLRIEAWRFEATAPRAMRAGTRFVPASALETAAVSGATRKVVRLAESRTQGRSQGGTHAAVGASSSSSGRGSGARGRRKA